MRIVVFGATGNIGTSLLQVLGNRDDVSDVVAVARRLPDDEVRDASSPQISWRGADIAADDLDDVVADADVVVNLAWLFHPSHRPDETWHNVLGSLRVFEAVARQRVPALLHSSSVGAYSPRLDGSPVDESWPTHGTSSAAYTREKAYLERLLDVFERDVSSCRVVRLRPAFVFHQRAAVQQRRLFAGPLLPGSLVRPGLVPVLPVPRGLLLQAVHSDDVARAFAAAATSQVVGAFNVCADDVLEADDLAALLDARPISLPPAMLKAAFKAAWAAHLVPAAPLLFDALMHMPVMGNDRAKQELGWQPQTSASDALAEFFEGLRGGLGHPTPPLAPGTSGPLRSHEVATGVGEAD